MSESDLRFLIGYVVGWIGAVGLYLLFDSLRERWKRRRDL